MFTFQTPSRMSTSSHRAQSTAPPLGYRRTLLLSSGLRPGPLILFPQHQLSALSNAAVQVPLCSLQGYAGCRLPAAYPSNSSPSLSACGGSFGHVDSWGSSLEILCSLASSPSFLLSWLPASPSPDTTPSTLFPSSDPFLRSELQHHLLQEAFPEPPMSGLGSFSGIPMAPYIWHLAHSV